MSGPGHGGDVAPAGATDALRLAVLDAAEGLGEADVLRLAVQQCVAALGGLGGLAHLAGREHDTLRLAAAGGVPDPVARAWERVDDHRLAPVRAMDRRQVQWSPRWPDDPHHAAPGHPGTARAEPGGSEAGGSEAGGSEAGGRRPDGVPPGLRACGLLSAPILVDGSPVGVLSVLAEREPAPDRGRFLAEVAALVGVRLPVARRWRSGTTPWWQEPQGVGGQVMRQISVGTWTWDLDTGLLDIDEVTEGMVELAGLDPDAWDHRIESWMERIHPDDRPGVQEAIEESLTYGRPYAVEHRVLDDAGRVNWLELRAAIERDDSGRPVRMVGTVWNITARRSQLEWLAGLLELNPDPIFVVAADNRVQWANRAARQLGGGGDVTGRTPWETEPLLRERGLPELLDRARAAPGSSATLEVDVEHPAPRGTASYLVKAVEIGGFMSIQMSDTTERRRAEQAAAERGRQVADLNAALVRALNTQDVVAAVVQHVLPLVHADGLVVHDLTGSVPRLIGDIGFSPPWSRSCTPCSCGRPRGSSPRKGRRPERRRARRPERRRAPRRRRARRRAPKRMPGPKRRPAQGRNTRGTGEARRARPTWAWGRGGRGGRHRPAPVHLPRRPVHRGDHRPRGAPRHTVVAAQQAGRAGRCRRVGGAAAGRR